ncbi:MAG: biopolymer transporter ExbD [Paludibacteraceae bacterium]
MAELQQTSSGRRDRTRQKKAQLKVDFTPMVDMNMLLITFFMLATTMSKPQTMKITMPTNFPAPPTTIPKSKAVTVYLGKEHQVYYFVGEPDLHKPNYLTQTNFASDGLRKVLLDKNAEVIKQVKLLYRQKATGQVPQKEYEHILTKLKDNFSIVLIKPLDTSTYSDMVNALDEMLITNIGKYMVAKLDENDKRMLKNSNVDIGK